MQFFRHADNSEDEDANCSQHGMIVVAAKKLKSTSAKKTLAEMKGRFTVPELLIRNTPITLHVPKLIAQKRILDNKQSLSADIIYALSFSTIEII